YARVVRGQTLSLRETDFIQAARGLGCPAWWILLRHVLPNVVSYALVIMTTEIGRLIVLECTLSFLGLGVPPPTPSWGLALADGKEYLIRGWWLATFPGLAIMVIVLSMNVLGDGARDVLAGIRKAVTPDDIARRPPTMWRYRELLPVRDEASIVTMGEGFTPMIPVPKAAREVGVGELWVKDEGVNPTGTFKAR